MAIDLLMESRTYRLKGTSPLLGSNPANEEIHSQYIASKAQTLERRVAEENMLPTKGDLPTPEGLDEAVAEMEQRGLTVFLRDNHGCLCIGNHAIKGFFKGALVTLKDQIGIAAAKSKADNLLFIRPDFVPIMDGHGEPQTEPDGIKQRPLRADTAMGPRETLVSSEMVDVPWQIEFTVTVVANNGTRASRKLDFDCVEAALDYGALKGLGQWRNGGYGSFTWERIDGGEDK